LTDAAPAARERIPTSAFAITPFVPLLINGLQFIHPTIDRRRTRIKNETKEIILGFLLLAALIGLTIVCWDGLGYIYEALFSVAASW